MLLKDHETGHLVEVTDLIALVNPFEATVMARIEYGEEISDPESLVKANLRFPSGESLPRCWLDPHYRDEAQKGRHSALA